MHVNASSTSITRTHPGITEEFGRECVGGFNYHPGFVLTIFAILNGPQLKDQGTYFLQIPDSASLFAPCLYCCHEAVASEANKARFDATRLSGSHCNSTLSASSSSRVLKT